MNFYLFCLVERKVKPVGRIVIMTDGGATANPGRAAAAYVVKDEKDGIICVHGEYVGETTNNVAEYRAVLKALEYVKEHFDESDCLLLSDSRLVVEQLNGNYEVKSEKLIPLWVRVKELINEMAVTVKWIPREENKMADFLVTMVRRGNSG